MSMHLLSPAPFGRVVPAMITPMRHDGSIDFERAQQVARQLVADGADGLVVNGTTGESPTTHLDEKVELVRAVKDAVSVPVVSGAGSNDTAHTLRMVEQLQQAGADALLIVAPYYSRPSQEGIFRHYQAVDAASEKPCIVYDVPARTGVHLELSTYRRIAKLEHVVAVKDATGDVAAALIKREQTGLAWYSGDDSLIVPFLSVGAVGVISVIAHAAAGRMQELFAAFDSADLERAQAIATELAPLAQALNGNGFQAVMAKAALRIRGVLSDTSMRLPNVEPNAKQLDRAEEGMRAAHLL